MRKFLIESPFFAALFFVLFVVWIAGSISAANTANETCTGLKYEGLCRSALHAGKSPLVAMAQGNGEFGAR